MAVSLTVKSADRPIVSAEKKTSSKDGADLMVKKGIGSLVVSDSGKLVGIVTERDLVRRVVALGKDPNRASLGEVMSAPLVTTETTKGLGEAAPLMLSGGVRRLVVVENGKMIGIFSQRDIQQEVEEVFRSIAEVAQTMLRPRLKSRLRRDAALHAR